MPTNELDHAFVTRDNILAIPVARLGRLIGVLHEHQERESAAAIVASPGWAVGG